MGDTYSASIDSFGFIDPTAQVLDPHLSIFLKAERIRMRAHSRIDGLVKIEGGEGVDIGEHVHIASFSHINAGGGRVIFGDHSGCASHVVIAAGLPDLGFAHISAADLPGNIHPLRMLTKIGRYVVIFAGAVICPGVEIEDFAVIAAGAVVTKDVLAGEIWAGVPAKQIGERQFYPQGALAAFLREVA